MSEHDWDALGQQWQQQAQPAADDVRTLEAALHHYRQTYRRGLYGDGFGLLVVAGLLVWTLLAKPGHAVIQAGLTLGLLLWQGGLWWLRRHWGLDHACTGLRQMLQADLRLARYRLLYHALGLPLGALMLAWAWPQLPSLVGTAQARTMLVAVALGSVGYALWAGWQARRRIARMRVQLQRLDDGEG